MAKARWRYFRVPVGIAFLAVALCVWGMRDKSGLRTTDQLSDEETLGLLFLARYDSAQRLFAAARPLTISAEELFSQAHTTVHRRNAYDLLGFAGRVEDATFLESMLRETRKLSDIESVNESQRILFALGVMARRKSNDARATLNQILDNPDGWTPIESPHNYYEYCWVQRELFAALSIAELMHGRTYQKLVDSCPEEYRVKFVEEFPLNRSDTIATEFAKSYRQGVSSIELAELRRRYRQRWTVN